MRKLKEITPYDIENTMKLIGKDWMLITASDGKKVNTMTASWGNMGVLWGKNVCTVYIRPQRYTYEFVEKSDRLSLSFFDDSYRDALKVCGTVSGRDCDKLERTGLTAATVDSVPIISQARLVIICKKLYADDIKPEKFLSDEPLSNYKQNDFHRFYICEIEKVLVAQEA
ncbi:MAG: flavin reductase family protein [Clostridia bacterium]|nr:flavin reductase family protein [Clostridia bacterium]